MQSAATHIRSLIELRIGLDGSLLTQNILERAIRERMALLDISSLPCYVRQVSTDSLEFQELIELVLVPETWFFRERAAFDYLTVLCKALYAKNPIRILSVPSSSGEEPYSIVMSLLSARIPLSHFVVEAADISKKALAKAQGALFGKSSFRSRDLFFRDLFFKETREGYRLHKEVANRVHFEWANLNDPLSFSEKKPYDIIFCRNCLIYLSSAAQKQVFEHFRRMLKPEGTLFVAAAEVAKAIDAGFSLKHPFKACALAQKIQPPDFLEEEKLEKASPFSVIERNDPRDLLIQARLLADKERFDEAHELCKKYIKMHALDPEGYFLFGVIAHAQNNLQEAEAHFQKAVYLQPKHQDALLYLGLIAKEHGDDEAAERFLERARQES